MMTSLEETLRESEERFHSLFEAASLGIVVVGLDGRMLQVSPALRRMFGYVGEELVGQPLELLLPEHMRALHALHRDAYARAPRARPARCGEDLFGRRKNGQTFPIEVRLRHLRLDGQAVLGAIVTDITERRRIEQERDRLLLQEQAAHAMAEASHQRSAMLSIATQAFNVANLDSQAVFDAITHWTAEIVGDACALHLLAGDGQYLILGASYHPDPAAQASLQAMLGEHPQPISEILNGRVVQADQSLLMPILVPEQIRTMVKQEYWPSIDRFGVHSCMIAPLRAYGQVIGTLAVVRDRTPAPYTEHDQIFLQDLADRAALAIHNARLFEQVRIGRERLQVLSRQLVRAQEDERWRLAHELHDEIGQSLTAAQINLQLLLSLPDQGDLPGRLEDSLALIDHVLQQVRTLSLDLRPVMLDDLGLVAALHWYVRRQAERAGLTAHFVAEPPALRTSPEIETTCFRIAQEALTNIARHAQARQVSVELRQHDTDLSLAICDDGVGFDVAEVRSRTIAGASMGVLGMQERALLVGGQVTLESARGGGTRVSARFPLPGPSGKVEPIERRKARR